MQQLLTQNEPEKMEVSFEDSLKYFSSKEDQISDAVLRETLAHLTNTFRFLQTNPALVSSTVDYNFERVLLRNLDAEFGSLESYIDIILSRELPQSSSTTDGPGLRAAPLPEQQPKQGAELLNDITYLHFLNVELSLAVLTKLTHHSLRISERIQEFNGLPVFFAYMRNRKFLDSCKRIQTQEPAINMSNTLRAFKSMLSLVITNLTNLSVSSNLHLEKWKELHAVQTLHDVAEEFDKDEDFKLTAYTTLANIASDEEITNLRDLHVIIGEIVKYIGTAAEAIRTKVNLTRDPFQLKDSDEVDEVCTIKVNGTEWSLLEFLGALYRMCVCDHIKYEVYEKHKMCQYLRDIIYNGNDSEIEHAIKLLWQLCYDKRVAEHVRQDVQLKTFIKNLMITTKDRDVSRNCSGIIWLGKKAKTSLVDEEVDSKADQEKSEEMPNLRMARAAPIPVEQPQPKAAKKQEHIMISYNSASRETCLKIKEQLEKLNYKVWIDVSDIHGSSLESMANAIQESFCVLLCMTEKYKMSNFCRAEAEYTFTLGKPYVPLIMQPNYKPDGWLGIILGSKIFIDFNKYDFEVAMTRLKNEINRHQPSSDLQLNPTISTMPTTSKPESAKPAESEKNKVLAWTDKEVKNWLTTNKIHAVIMESIYPCNGQILHQYYLMKSETPEFFYQSLMGGKSVALKYLAAFVVELTRLFDSKSK